MENLCLTLSVPGRPFLFHTGETYHTYNQGIDRRKVFTDEGDYKRALLSLEFYQVKKPVTSLSLFLSKFTKEEREKELAAARYTLLNPYTAGVVKTLDELEKYPYSALPDYLGRTKRSICDKTPILSHFKNRESFKKFILDRADYQRSLEEIKHLILE